LRFAIPTPTTSAVEIGPFTIHFYALCIIAGVAAAIWLGNKRFCAHTENGKGVVADVAIYAVPAGVIGGRLYHVVTTPEDYFGRAGNLFDIVKIWNGGLGIWGAIAVGVIAAFFSYRHIAKKKELPSFLIFADAVAPGLLIAQGIGRWGNWFNAELFGRPLNAPWALEIPEYARPSGFESFGTFHPTFLYESIWCFLIAAILIALGNRRQPGTIFSQYVLLYALGRFIIESIRIDRAHEWAGLRLNQYVAILAVAGAIAALLKISRTSR
jgi:prolipoprotein diacylglyceryl transferase